MANHWMDLLCIVQSASNIVGYMIVSRHDEHVIVENKKLTDEQKQARHDADNELDRKRQQSN